ncbi:Predicted choloylglycine hydrolase [Cognatiyoonia koreensis]|uniref:Predicted choloylglycine hydrolase n=1 Tax=Cognatiyoonia koreensis TaxID=364200 RepID=A0A1I0MXA3_9RHOB|nr:C45 family peptidase [Cognatiyoonia koreensis]SEV93392.1 Predicted choloylglycine hydrolase [Cognatiyoonia koreensis]
MTNMTLTFDAVEEAKPGPKWAARWARSWPDYEAWFVARGGDAGPSRADCRAALKKHMPELIATYDELVAIAGGSDRAARFLATWCPPTYLGGCSLAAVADRDDVRLVRNYDLSPDLNEGLLLRTEWTGRAVMGMVEFLWGLSDGINDAGLSVALAYGGRSETGIGFGITTILRYLLETCDTVAEAIAVLKRIPSHMAYNVVLADKAGQAASIELAPGGGATIMPQAIATNHQSKGTAAHRPHFTQTVERLAHLKALKATPRNLGKLFLEKPLRQDRYAQGFGTLFTAEYDPKARSLVLWMNGERWDQSLDAFQERQHVADYSHAAIECATGASDIPADHTVDWSRAAMIDWSQLSRDYAMGRGQDVSAYLPAAATIHGKAVSQYCAKSPLGACP